MSEKKEYKVLVSGIVLANNTTARGGAIIPSNQLLDNADELVKGGYIEEVKKAVSKPKASTKK